ncbi:MAG: hypothetical protein RJB66_996 [Pseudomonadota bacterium]|jgi:hypothetical protein
MFFIVWRFLIYGLFFGYSANVFSIELSSNQLQSLSRDPYWHRLLHYKDPLFSNHTESQADDAQFFLASDGKSSPLNELKATLVALQAPKKRTLHVPLTQEKVELSALCQFPARAKWLKEQLKNRFDLDLSIDGECAEYKKFVQRLRARSVTLVFSSYYMNNPSSTFGHSLLRLNRQKHSERNEKSTELLDIGVNYAANATTKNPFLYAVLGMAGGFPGTFTVIPYYYKVREYNDYESRDLWEYDLALTDQEVERLVDHLWELSFTTFDYYYITENCSYHMLTLLEVAAPRLSLVEKLPFWIIPGETIKPLSETPGLIDNIIYRPSVYRQLKERVSLLTDEEFKSFNKWRGDDQSWRGTLNPQELARVLDAGLDYYDYKFANELLLERSGSRVVEKNNWLLERSELPAALPLKIIAPLDVSPDKAHPSGRGGLRISEKERTEFFWRFALHDFLDPIAGYPDYAQIDFFSLGWIHDRALSKNLLLEKFHLVGITSLSPINRLDVSPSWRVSFGWEREPEISLVGAPAFLRSAVGATYKFESTPISGLIAYTLFQGKVSHTMVSTRAENLFLSVGPVLGLRWATSPKSNFVFEGLNEAILEPRKTQRLTWALAQTLLAGKDDRWLFEARLSKTAESSEARGALGVYYYF